MLKILIEKERTITSFTSSVSALISAPISVSVSFSILVFFGGGIDSVLTSVFLSLLVSTTELFTDPSRV